MKESLPLILCIFRALPAGFLPPARLIGAGAAQCWQLSVSYGMLSFLVTEGNRKTIHLFLLADFLPARHGVTLIRHSPDSDPPKARL